MIGEAKVQASLEFDNYTSQTGFKSFDECRIGCRIEYKENDKNFYICEDIQNESQKTVSY